MIVGREEMIILDKLANQQERIYPDACDFGVRVDGIHSARKSIAREAIQSLRETFKSELEISEDRRYSKTVIFIPIEKDQGMYAGIEYIIEYFNTTPGVNGLEFLSIESCRTYRENAGFK